MIRLDGNFEIATLDLRGKAGGLMWGLTVFSKAGFKIDRILKRR
jgi:hypothetical protein